MRSPTPGADHDDRVLGRRAAILVRMATIAELNLCLACISLACVSLACGLRRFALRHGCRALYPLSRS
jgi:hypothetical protein